MEKIKKKFFSKRFEYNSTKNKTAKLAKLYENTVDSPFRYLGYRDLPIIISKYSRGKKALDYGCGTGISSKFLYDLGFDVTGTDTSKKMLKRAQKTFPYIEFQLFNSLELKNQFDIVFSSFVLFELKSSKEIINYLLHAKKLIKNEGIFIAITGSEDLYSKDWFIWDSNFSENKKLKSGKKVKLLLKDLNIIFTDYYWKEDDYFKYYKNAGLEIINIFRPLGKTEEKYFWKDELKFPPFIIIVAKKAK
ncbi:MAG: class I SAM-dependent methyltransferase [Parachlamydiales bacterium]|nr:class I SAM-dependent methyltransferase [Parachlamydiales bacterium]